MNKKISVLVINNNSDLKNIQKGSIITVSRGYALNYLIPKQIAQIITKGKIKHIQMLSEINKEKQKANISYQELLKRNINKIKKISLYKKKGENQLIFGSITEKDISRSINKYNKINITKFKITFKETKLLGITSIEYNQDTSVKIQIPLHVIPINI